MLGEYFRGGRPPVDVLGAFCRGVYLDRGVGRLLSRNKAAMQARAASPARPVVTRTANSARPRPLPLASEGEIHEEQVEGDDDGRDEETCDAQGAIVDVVAHDLTVCGQAHEWDDREGDAEREGDL